MDHEQKTELKQNDLANWLQYGLPMFIRNYGSYLLLAIALAILGYQLWAMYERRQAAALQDAWTQLAEAASETADNPPAKLKAIINNFDNKAVQAQAFVKLGNFYLQSVIAGSPVDGYRGVKINKDDALEEAAKAFTRVINEFPEQTLAIKTARMGLASTEESRRNWDAAKKQYESLIQAGGLFGDEATTRLKRLEDIRTPVSFGPSTTPPATTRATTTTAPATQGK